MFTHHLLDCLAVVLPLRRGTGEAGQGALRVLDVGSGAGLPGVPIAISRPTLSVTTVDAVAKKIGFQRQVRTACGLDNLHPHHAQVEALTLDEKPSLIVSRAFSAIGAMLEAIAHLASPATTIVAMKGLVPTDELEHLPASWSVREIRELDVPFLGARRCAVVLGRSGRDDR
jgi:16S rRNA (guanine527-N7)-methyltransferase